jgi:hypothetical protein
MANSRPPVEPEDPDDIRHIVPSQPWFFKFVEYLFEYISTPHRPLYRRERWVYKKDKNNNKHSNKSRVAAPDPDKS